MKRYLISYFALMISSVAFAQKGLDASPAFSISQDWHDYNVSLLDGKWTSFDSSLSTTTRISYFQPIGIRWDLQGGFSNGFIYNQKIGDYFYNKSSVVGFDVDLIYKWYNGRILPVESAVGPFFTFGYNFNYVSNLKKSDRSPWSISNEYGAGLRIKVGKKMALLTQVALDQQLNNNYGTHIQYRLGLKYHLNRTSDVIDEEYKRVYRKEDQADAQLLDSLRFQMLVIQNRLRNLQWDLDSMDDEIVQVTYSDPIEIKKAPTPKMEAPIPPKDEPTIGIAHELPEPSTEVEIIQKEEEKPAFVETPTTEPEKIVPQKADPAVETAQSHMKLGYYVVVMSTKMPSLIETTFQKYKGQYPVVEKLPQPTGYTRIGIYCGSDKTEAIRLLNYVKQYSEPSAWLSQER